MQDRRDLSDPVARSAAGAACLIQFRDEWEARAESDCWIERHPSYMAIHRHAGRTLDTILNRNEE